MSKSKRAFSPAISMQLPPIWLFPPCTMMFMEIPVEHESGSLRVLISAYILAQPTLGHL